MPHYFQYMSVTVVLYIFIYSHKSRSSHHCEEGEEEEDIGEEEEEEEEEEEDIGKEEEEEEDYRPRSGVPRTQKLRSPPLGAGNLEMVPSF